MRKVSVVALLLGGLTLSAVADDDAASKAYELRMKGKVDEAKELLDRAILEEPENAAAHFELARLQIYMALGDPTDPEKSFGDALLSIERATDKDPENPTYHFLEGHLAFLRAYLSLHGMEPDTKDHLARACGAFEAALKAKPDCHQAILHLIEIHGHLPPQFGGDREKAVDYEKQLMDLSKASPDKAELKVSCAKAKAILQPEECGVAFWRDVVLKDHPEDADVLEELGKAHLREDEVEDAGKYFAQAVEKDSERVYVYLDLAVYHTFRAMEAGEDKELRQSSLTAGDAAVTRYLDSEPIPPMQAYALGVQYKFKKFLGEEELAQTLLDKAKAIDPYFSKATAPPNRLLFAPPGEIPRTHRHLMRPF